MPEKNTHYILLIIELRENCLNNQSIYLFSISINYKKRKRVSTVHKWI